MRILYCEDSTSWEDSARILGGFWRNLKGFWEFWNDFKRILRGFSRILAGFWRNLEGFWRFWKDSGTILGAFRKESGRILTRFWEVLRFLVGFQ